MNRKEAKIIAETITNKELLIMFKRAKLQIKDWTKVSRCNLGFTKGVAWNILARGFSVDEDIKPLAKVNMVREFGDYLPEILRVKKPAKRKNDRLPVHHEPDFTGWEESDGS